MTRQGKETHKRDDLDLDAETVKDLEPTEEDTEAVRGGEGDTAAVTNCRMCGVTK